MTGRWKAFPAQQPALGAECHENDALAAIFLSVLSIGGGASNVFRTALITGNFKLISSKSFSALRAING